ncbi:uridine kinase [Natranaerovirga pectinivora]|uniref:Uridine kinase n=1 Tax=Natranaerovirga pectinivora TaxID=682400 RepID=A0A4V2V0P6_9FIRM|nr:uridine kinase [Natranaerovirga pectinivora]TCT17169.1 uridine kinase [Natranaerovirga pectinivora]
MDFLISDIQKNLIANKNNIIGIDGGTGAGKSTILTELQLKLESLGLRVIPLSIDDFIHKRAIRYDTSQEEWYCFYKLQWRYNYLINEILAPAKAQEKLDKQIELYDKEKDQYNMVPLNANTPYIILLEGMFLQRNTLKRYFDYISFMDVPKEDRVERVLRRDTYIGNEAEIYNKYESRYFPAEDYYFKRYTPLKKAHSVIRSE